MISLTREQCHALVGMTRRGTGGLRLEQAAPLGTVLIEHNVDGRVWSMDPHGKVRRLETPEPRAA